MSAIFATSFPATMKKIEQDCTGEIFCGVSLSWHCEAGYVYMYMPGYVKFYYSNPRMLHHWQRKMLHPHGSA